MSPKIWTWSAIALLGAAAAWAGTAQIDPFLDDSNADHWPSYGRTYGEQHYSPLTQINGSNVGELGLAWYLDLPVGNVATQPIEADGVVYFAMGHSIVNAVDAETGKLLWRYDPEVYKTAGHKLRIGWGSRGVAWYDGMVYTVTIDGKAIALDARTGKVRWTQQVIGPDDISYVTGAPRIFAGKLIIGNSGDNGAVRGHVTALDAKTGKQLWRFWAVPGDPAKGYDDPAMAKAAKTWSGRWWEKGGGGTPWNAFSYDPETNTVFVGTGNGFPYNARLRSPGGGDNLFLAAIVALDANTGRYKWHYQAVPGDSWDYTMVHDMQFAELEIGGRKRKVLMTAPKNGFFYVLDRMTGELISAEPFAKVTWAKSVDLKTGRPVEDPAARYQDRPFEGWPSSSGAHNWQAMAYDPGSKLVYIPVLEQGAIFSDTIAETRYDPKSPFTTGVSIVSTPRNTARNGPEDGTASLIAWDPVAQKRRWRVEAPRPITAGVMATGGGLVFQGAVDSTINAYDSRTGARRWSFATQAPVLVGPISYAIKGRQYVTVIAGMGSAASAYGSVLQSYHLDYLTMPRRLLTFALKGAVKLPPAPVPDLGKLDDPDFRPDPKLAEHGRHLFINCAFCHGFNAVAAGRTPDLRRSSLTLSQDAFAAVVRDGALVPNGMPRFEEFTTEQLEALRHYIRTEAHDPANDADGGSITQAH